MSLKKYLNPVFFPPTAKDTEWVSEYEAAEMLGISEFRLSFVIFNQHLDPVKNSQGIKGVARKSLAKEVKWRRDAPLSKKILRVLGDIVNFA